MRKRSIELQVLINGVWKWHSYLIRGANRPGHYGPAADHWKWAKYICDKYPEEYRVLDCDDNTVLIGAGKNNGTSD